MRRDRADKAEWRNGQGGAVRRLFIAGVAGMVGALAVGAGLARAAGDARPAAPRGRVLLTVSGAVSRPNVADGPPRHQFDAEMIDALPVRTVRTHTPWHKGLVEFTGPSLADVLDAAGARGQMAQMTAINDYQVRMPLAEVLPHRPILARRANGVVLAVRDKGPLFLIFPYDDVAELRTDVYQSRSIWQLKDIEVR